MRKLLLSLMAMAFVVLVAGFAIAADDYTATSTVTADVGSVFEIAFYSDTNIQFPTGGPITFTDVDASQSMVYPDGRAEGDGKSDVGLLLLSNDGGDVNLKVHVAGIDNDNFVVYIPNEVYYRNTGETLGGLQHSEGWYAMWNAPHTIYTADAGHLLTAPLGTLITLSYAIVPSGHLEDGGVTVCSGDPLGGGSHSATIFYTLTNTL